MTKTATKILCCFLFLLASQGFAHAQTPEDEPTLREKKTEEGFLVNLKDLIRQSQKKIESVNDRLMDQAKERRNQEREIKAQEYFEKAERMTEEGNAKGATVWYEKAIEITNHPEMEDYIDQSAKRQKAKERALDAADKRRTKRLEQERGYSAKEVNKKYKKAEKMYKKEKFIEAKGLFEEVDLMFPDHKATRSYLALVDIQIENEQKGIIASALDDGFFRNPKKEKWRNELERKEMERREKLEVQAEEVYQEAVSLYKDNQFSLAQQRFKEVEWILPDYKKTLSYLRKVDKNIEETGVRFTDEEKTSFFKRLVKKEREEELNEKQRMERAQYYKSRDDEKRLEEEADFVYDTAVALYKKGYYNQSLDKFMEVQEIYPGYENTGKYLDKLSKKIPERASESMVGGETKNGFFSGLTKMFGGEEEKVVSMPSKDPEYISQSSPENLKRYGTEADVKYGQAIQFYNSGNYVEAQRKFIAVEALFPGYKDTRNYLAQLDEEAFQGKGMAPPRIQKPKPMVHSTGQKSEPMESSLKSVSDAQSRRVHKTGDVKEMYALGKKYFKSRNYKLARDMFVSVEEIKPGYKSSPKYLKKINKELAHEQKERQKYQKDEAAKSSSRLPASPAVSEAEKERRIAELKGTMPPLQEGERRADLSSLDREQIHMEREAETEIEMEREISNIDREGLWDEPLSKKDQKRLKQRQKEIEKMAKKADVHHTADLDFIIEDVYAEGKQLYKDKRYASAKAKFATVERLSPGYRNAKDLIKKIDKKIASGDMALENEMTSKRRKLAREEGKYEGAEIARLKHADREYASMSDEEYKERLNEDNRSVDDQRAFAKNARLQRMDEERLLLMEEKEAFYAEEKRKQKELERVAAQEQKFQRDLAKDKMRIEKDKIKEAKRKRRQELNQIEKDLENIKNETLALLRENEQTRARAMMVKYEELLLKADYSETKRIRLRDAFSVEKVNIQHELEQQRREKERKSFHLAEDLRDEDDKKNLEIKRSREIEGLEQRIKEEERELAREKRKEERRLRKLETKNLKSSEKMAALLQEKESLEFKTMDEMERAKLLDVNKKEMTKIYANRQKELTKQRERIQKELSKNVANLYRKATVLHKQGYYEQAAMMFSEIDRLSPNYKKTRTYLSGMQGQVPPSMMQDTTSYARPSAPQHKNRKNAVMRALDRFESNYLW